MFQLFKKFFDRPDAGPKGHDTRTRVRDTEEEFAKLVAGVRDYAVFLLDRSGHVRTWNAGAERFKGYRAEEIIGKHFSVFYPNEVVSTGFPAHELSVAAATGRFEDEGWRVRRDGTRFWASVVITALRDESGEVRGYLKITRDLTDRKQAEEKLRLGEERFRLLVEGVKDYAIFMLDPEGRVATWNTGAERLKGYKASEIIGQHFSRFYPEDAIARGWPEEELKRAGAEGTIEDEGWRIRKDGSRFWASVVISALRDEAGVLRGYAKVTRDLTDRRQSEENTRRLLQEEAARKAAQEAAGEIERQREQLHVTLASIGDAVVVTDRRGVITFLNHVALTMIGCELDEAVGNPIEEVFQIINEQTRARVENPVERAFQENRIIELANHTALISKTGREVPIEDSAAPIRDSDGTIHGAVLVFRDVTASRRAMETRLYLAAIVESSDDAIIGHTLDGMIASWNRGAERLYGYTAAEAIGKPLSLLVSPEHQDELPAITDRLARGEFIEHFETERVRKDGKRIQVSLTMSPVKDGEGNIIGASKIGRDITARKEEDRRKNEFLALLAHELRNPLAPLRNGLQVIKLAGDDRSAIEQARSVMERQLQHLVRLVDDLLDVARISGDKLHLRKSHITIAAVIQQSLELCGQNLRDQQHELILSLPDEPLYVNADPTRLVQAICNLLSNAAKYSESGKPVWLTVAREKDEAVIRVKDMGIGIPADMLPRVFDMFVQVDRSLEKSQGGLGIGLSLVKRLVEMHGGHVEAHSEGEGQGSEFVVRLPLVASGIDEELTTAKSNHACLTAGRRILVVDDNTDAANSLTMLLRIMGHEVHVAHNGQSGLDLATEIRPDVVLLDIGMPELNGYEVARRIRQEPWGNLITLVALTGWGQDEDRRKADEAGFDVHMVKPIEPAALDRLLSGADPESV
jgi:PAS domain S-box-containing protein